ncbi:MAG: MCE family protein [Zoogloeaceae bacterium]|nr:MCE family protein [Zoogloeaceae bacterium]
MENRAHALAAGVFVLIFALAGVLALWWFGNNREPVRRYVLVSEGAIPGLNEQAQVRFRGIRAGKVMRIGIDPDNPRWILVEITLRADLPVTRGTRASLGYQGLTGIAFVQLNDSGSDPTPLAASNEDLPRLPLEPGLMEQLAAVGPQALHKLEGIVDQLSRLFDATNVARLSHTIESLDAAAAGARETFREAPLALAGLRRVLSPENMAHLQATLSHLDAVTAEAAPTVSELRRLAVKLQGLSERVDRLAASTHHQLESGTVPKANALLEELTDTSRRMARLLEAVEGNPGLLLFGKGTHRPGPGEPGFAAPAATGGTR